MRPRPPARTRERRACTEDQIASARNAPQRPRLYLNPVQPPPGAGAGAATRPTGPHDGNGWGHDRSWHFRWDGPVSAVDIAAALTDALVGLSGSGATGVLRRWHPLVVELGRASLTLHGNL